MLRTLTALAEQWCRQACKHVSCQPQLETDYAVDHPFFHRPSFRIRNHDVHREPLIFSGPSEKRTGAQRVRFFHRSSSHKSQGSLCAFGYSALPLAAVFHNGTAIAAIAKACATAPSRRKRARSRPSRSAPPGKTGCWSTPHPTSSSKSRKRPNCNRPGPCATAASPPCC